MAAGATWSQRLREHCAARGFSEPAWQDISDRRGGRTAWSCIVNVQGQHHPARFWYDGAFMQQAREDAAEMALRNITGYANTNADPPPASHYARS
ncbi:hypothetical protein K458DRAFT_417981 [Lentithecium fluviatile CBS 122367]|uniref:DRBM domain-containing protein n=1 Tax=Lentithecium fluviatile CBS 122367 TaxID=1168545 RepID=A0A6G1J1K1_9PLEO|nr:hypothetical protein K458DRAFT_417981 [Lentithecium fluviatile CBS 122367]